MSFVTRRRIGLHLVDAAGITFFGHAFTLAHEAYEEYLREAGIGWNEWFGGGATIAPIREAKATYEAPLLGGEEYELLFDVTKVGMTSFTMETRIMRGGRTHVAVMMVAVLVDKATQRPMPIPDELRRRLRRTAG